MPSEARQLPPSEDAAIALALAETALPFADSRSGEVEQWIRILRMHGEVGQAMQALGTLERPLARPDREDDGGERVAVDDVYARASRAAAGRGRKLVSTADLLEALIEIYGALFDRMLEAHGVATSELLERLRRPR